MTPDINAKLRALHDEHHGACDALDDTYEHHCEQAKLIRAAARLAYDQCIAGIDQMLTDIDRRRPIAADDELRTALFTLMTVRDEIRRTAASLGVGEP